jgi:hypothetical protein
MRARIGVVVCRKANGSIAFRTGVGLREDLGDERKIVFDLICTMGVCPAFFGRGVTVAFLQPLGLPSLHARLDMTEICQQ